MIVAALSPAVSWMLFLACVAVGAVMYVVVVGGRRYRRMFSSEDELRRLGEALGEFGPRVYDHESREDFR